MAKVMDPVDEGHEAETLTAAYSHKFPVAVIPCWVNVDNDALPDHRAWYLHGLHHPVDPTMNFAYHLHPHQVWGKVDNVPHPFHYYHSNPFH